MEGSGTACLIWSFLKGTEGCIRGFFLCRKGQGVTQRCIWRKRLCMTHVRVLQVFIVVGGRVWLGDKIA